MVNKGQLFYQSECNKGLVAIYIIYVVLTLKGIDGLATLIFLTGSI